MKGSMFLLAMSFASLAVAAGSVPEVEVTGTLHPRGVTAARSQGEAEWTMQLTLHHWRIGDAGTDPAELELERQVALADVKAMQQRVAIGDLVRVRARLGPPVDGAPRRGELLEVLAVERGAGVPAQPVTRSDAVLGELQRDRRKFISHYRGKASFAGASVDVLVAPASDDRLDDALATAHALWPDADEWDARARRVAADQLLPTYFDAHGGPEAAPLDAQVFIERLQPAMVSVFEEGEFELWYDDDGLFDGRAVRVVGSLRDGPQAADLQD